MGLVWGGALNLAPSSKCPLPAPPIAPPPPSEIPSQCYVLGPHPTGPLCRNRQSWLPGVSSSGCLFFVSSPAPLFLPQWDVERQPMHCCVQSPFLFLPYCAPTL